MTGKSQFALMVKPVGSVCNMRCRYCYYIGNEASDRSMMSEEMLETLIRSYIESSEGPVVSFIWHGGEPTLRGLAFYRKAVELQKQYLPEGWECWNNLQTNGLALDDDWCMFLKTSRFDVGVSIDGTKLVHDMFRSDAAGAPTYERIRRNIRLLRSYGISPDLLCTVTGETAKHALKVYQELRSFQTGWIQFIPIVNHDETGQLCPESVTPASYGAFLCTLFREWVLKDLGRTNIQFFAEVLNIYNGGSPSVCWMQETCGRALVVESNGMVYSCDHFVDKDHCLGSIEDASLADYLNSTRQTGFGNAKKDVLSEACRQCPWLAYCHGGCLKDRFLPDHDNALCDGLKQFFEYADPVFKRIAELLKEHRKTGEIRKIIRREGIL